MVNQQFTFAVHILTALAFSRDRLASKTLAASVNTNPVVVRRLLAALRRAGLVETQAGKFGGARLSKKPDQIRLLEIYEAVEPRPVIAANCRTPSRHCQVSCNMQSIMAGVAAGAEDAMRQHLRGITLAQLVRKVSRPTPVRRSSR